MMYLDTDYRVKRLDLISNNTVIYSVLLEVTDGHAGGTGSGLDISAIRLTSFSLTPRDDMISMIMKINISSLGVCLHEVQSSDKLLLILS